MGHKGAPGAGGGIGGGAGAGAGLSAEGAEIAEGAELPAEGAADSWLQKPEPAGAPVRVGWARKKTSTELSSAQLASSALLAQLSSPAPEETLQDRTLAEVNQALAPVGSASRRLAAKHCIARK